MKNTEQNKYKMVYGVREGNNSLKLFKKKEGEYFIIKKHYIFGLFKRKEILYFKNIMEAQDYIIQNTDRLHSVYFE